MIRPMTTVSVLALIAGITPAGAAWAQAAAPTADVRPDATSTTVAAAEPASSNKDIVVTGSRIRRPDFSSPNPIVSIGAQTLEESGTTNLTSFLTGYPALQGSSTSGQNAGDQAGIGSTGLNLLDLRNLGTDRTLVLVDSRRHVSGLPGSQAVDINTIPEELIDRVDILTGGASAVYGADGVSGVVNFVLKRNFEGLTAKVQAGVSQRNDGGQRLYSVTAGHNFADNRGNIAIAFEHGEEDRLQASDRSYLRGARAVTFLRNPADPENQPGYTGGVSNGIPDRIPLTDARYADTAREGAIDVDFDGVADYLVNAQGQVVPFDPGLAIPGGYTQGGSATRVSDYGNDLLPRIKRNVVNLIGHFDVSPALTIFAEGKYARSKSFSLGQPTFDYYLQLQPDNAYIPAALAAVAPDGVLVTRDNFDFGQRGERIRRETWRGVIGARGDLGQHANYEVSYVYGRTNVTNAYQNDRITDRFNAALDAVRGPNGQITCRVNIDPTLASTAITFRPGECVPLNILGEGAPSQAALDFIRADTRDRSRLTQQVLSGSLSGDFGQAFSFPGGGNLGFALGAEYRRETSRYTPDPLILQGYTFSNQLLPTSGKFDVKEAFAELRAPLLTDLPFAHSLEVGAAVRLSDYSTIGHTKAYKFDASWSPIRDITFNGTYSTAVRAPNIGELFGGRSQTFAFINDPCNASEIQNGTSYRAANCAALLSGLGVANPSAYTDIRSTNLPGFAGGNAALKAETAKTWTAGVTLKPRFLSGFSARADWYDIKLKNAINTVDAEQLSQLCVDQATLNNQFCAAITRQNGPGGTTTNLPGNIIGFNVIPQNVAQFRTSGLDVNLNYVVRTAKAGTFSLNMIGNYLNRLEFVGTPGAPTTDSRGETYAPKYTVNTDLTWKIGKVSLNYGLLYFSKTLRFTNLATNANPDIVAPQYLYLKEHWQHDIYAKVQMGSKIEVYGGINNLFDQKPDLGTRRYPVDSLGRYLYAGMRFNLGRSR